MAPKKSHAVADIEQHPHNDAAGWHRVHVWLVEQVVWLYQTGKVSPKATFSHNDDHEVYVTWYGHDDGCEVLAGKIISMALPQVKRNDEEVVE